jgi:hypothetical protein
MNFIIICVSIGLIAGTLSGILGIGGAVVIIPALIYILKFSQHLAQGTTLALMVPPIGLLAALTYYRAGYVDLKTAGLICAGFFIGGLLGAKIAVEVPDVILRRLFGLYLLIVSLRMLLGK